MKDKKMTIESTRRDQQPSKEVLSKGDDCALRRLDKDRQRHDDDGGSMTERTPI